MTTPNIRAQAGPEETMTKEEVLRRLDRWERTGEPVDALCDAAEFLGWEEGEYSLDALREAVEAIEE